MANRIFLGVAGWTIPASHRHHFTFEGSHLVRYAREFPAVEINSTFYRSHRPATFARWAATVPDDFRFAVKLPREITHKRRLVDATALLEPFLAEVANLGDKLGVLLVQLPPSLQCEPAGTDFLAALRERHEGDIVCEPRHATWFDTGIDERLARLRIARVAADPAVVPEAAEPGGWKGLAYYRLHGSPRMYYSAYSDEQLESLAKRLAAHAKAGTPPWCIFDNTAYGVAIGNAVTTRALLRDHSR
jgi:uncharacterized protein YecE (DUF72 family)